MFAMKNGKSLGNGPNGLRRITRRLGVETLESKALLTTFGAMFGLGLFSDPNCIAEVAPTSSSSSTEGELIVGHVEVDTNAGTAEINGGVFRVGAGSDGIEPPDEDVTIGIGDFSVTIPAGSFSVVPAGGTQFCLFHGIIDGVEVEAEINPTGAAGEVVLSVAISNADLSSAGFFTEISFTVGDDHGSTYALTF